MPAARTLPDRNLILKLLDYNPQTGSFTWLPRPREMFATDRAFKIWNRKYAGKAAGYLHLHWRDVGIGVHHVLYKAHRLAWLIHYGEPVPDLIDHRDMNPSNNAILNLRAATHSQNGMNRGAQKNNPTGIKNIYKLRENYYHVIIGLLGKRHERTFRNLDDAVAWRNKMQALLHGEFARDEK